METIRAPASQLGGPLLDALLPVGRQRIQAHHIDRDDRIPSWSETIAS